MDVVATFGKVLEANAFTHPKRARRILLTGWRLQDAALALAPDKRLPSSRRYVSKVAMDCILDSLSHPDEAVAVSAFAPSEPLLAMGLKPLSVEQVSCFMAGSKAEEAFIQRAENIGFPSTLCSYHKTFLGTLESELMPSPRCTVYTNVACDGNLVTFPHVADMRDIPAFGIDVPAEHGEEAVSFVARQVHELARFLEDVLGRPFDGDSFRVHVERGCVSAMYYRDFLAAEKGRRLPSSMVTEMYAFLMNHVLMGSRETERFCRMLAEDMARAPEATGIPLVWLHTMPFSQYPVQRRFDFSDEAHITASDLSADPMLIDVDPTDPYDAVARRLVHSCFNGSYEHRVRCAIDLVERSGAMGVVLFNHWGCKATIGASKMIKEGIEEAGIPCLVLDGDGVNPSNRSDGQTSTRIDAFLEMLRTAS